MKKTFFLIILGVYYSLLLNAQQESDHFYYCFEEKIFLKQSTDKIYLKFPLKPDKEQIINHQ